MPNAQKQKKSLLIVIIIVIVLLIGFLLWWFMSRTETESNSNINTSPVNTNQNTNTAVMNNNLNTNTAVNTNVNKATSTSANIIAKYYFTSESNDWYEEVWYQAKSSGGEVTYSEDGVRFTAVQANSRSGIMTDVEKDVTGYSKLNLHLVVTSTQQTLSGTGWNGREAPVAVAISYLDADGVEHKLLGEDPLAAGQMFWRGFYTLDPTGQSVTTNGVKVTTGQQYTFDFDLMTLKPKPALIHFVAVEGAGWATREGMVHELSLVGIK
ncbi:MAG: hypothetical protein WC693_04540 [Patescibacteria group bacterium]|jgi:hypothetical protein